ncbi:hypothetical protein E2A64_04980 [Pseudohoeflea suaedae]|uniref:DUF4870 domain-containing protein n=1 Tax=Pseudohoeflea suaedae TaxID=877384 RepID=A0A4R5PN68_9HYPH|nr:hypothetical protein [Pseudohoeflea suaedae]TDH38466.1 hypothetical protein E2A64_04980 [Pseudohoeflea suaedae]
MSDRMQPPAPPSEDQGVNTDRWLEPGKANLQVIYALYLVSALGGITVIIGVVLAYMNRGKCSEWLETHYTWLIRTFWLGLLYGFISFLLFVVLIGMPLMVAVAVLMVVRLVIGLQKLGRNKPILHPDSWLI